MKSGPMRCSRRGTDAGAGMPSGRLFVEPADERADGRGYAARRADAPAFASTSSWASTSSLAPGPARCAQAIERDALQSIILWGPPGTGKTTIARLIADDHHLARFIAFSAVLSGIRDIRAGDDRGRGRPGPRSWAGARSSSSTRSTASTRRSRTPSCRGSRLATSCSIGATTENPSFEVNAALLSRSQVFVLQPADRGRNGRASCSRAPSTTRERGLGGDGAAPPTTTRWPPSRATPTATRGWR